MLINRDANASENLTAAPRAQVDPGGHGWIMRCPRCDYRFAGPREALAGISILVEGDEVIFSYFRCPECAAFSAEGLEDRFGSDRHTIWSLGAIPEAEGQRILALVEACPKPDNKFCRCAAHKALYTGRPRAIPEPAEE